MIVGLHRLGIDKKCHQQMYSSKFSHSLKTATAIRNLILLCDGKSEIQNRWFDLFLTRWYSSVILKEDVKNSLYDSICTNVCQYHFVTWCLQYRSQVSRSR